jgi:hypothetical protein
MKSSPWAVPLLVLGIVLLVVANWLAALLPDSAVWSDADAREFGKAAAEFHSAAHNRAHNQRGHIQPTSTAEGHSAEYTAAKAEFDKQQARLDGARSRVSFWKYGLQGVGVLLIGAGIGLHLHLRMKGDSK